VIVDVVGGVRAAFARVAPGFGVGVLGRAHGDGGDLFLSFGAEGTLIQVADSVWEVG
jgi:hypothetical protein